MTFRPGGDGLGTGTLGLGAAGAGVATLVDDVRISGAELASAERSEPRLLFASAPLAAPLHLSGTGRLRIRMAASEPAANLSVWVVSLPWTPDVPTNENLVTRGWADPRNHASLEAQEPLVPGDFVELDFTLQPDDQIVPPGARLGLMILSSDRDFTLWPEPGTEVTVDLSTTELELPVVGGGAAARAALGG